MTEQKGEQFTKRVEWKEADDERQIATGVVMVPDKVDLQGDFVREETIRSFAEDFMARLPDGGAQGGVMHAVFPEDHVTLVENNVLDEPRTIAGEDVPAGAWTQSWKFDDAELWTLVRDGILSGYSIGAEQVGWSDPMAQDDRPDDVEVADAYPDEEPVWELQEATVREVSSVDIPAVPDAEILATKDGAEKRVADHLGDKDGFIDEMLERGHDQAAAERMWSYLQRAVDEEEVDVEEADAPSGVLQRMGKAALSALSGSDDDTKTAESEAPDSEKEGRTLSRGNRNALFASIDASLDVLEDAGVDHGMTRFTDRDDVAFTLDDHTASEWSTDEEEEEDDEDTPTVLESAPGGDTPDDDKSMSDDPMEDAPEWAKALHDDIEENSKHIEELTSEDSEKSGDGEGGDDDPEKDAFDEAPEWAKALKQETEKNAQRIDDVAKASGTSQQLEADGQSSNPNRKYSSEWDKTLGLSAGGDA